MAPPTKHCLLVIDDEPDVCDSVHDLLRREFRVLKATSAQEGYRILQEDEVHIVMTDQRMPSITGVELLARVKARQPQAIRMLFTGYADLESIVAAINQGHVFQFLKKPWRPEDLLDAVRLAAAEYDRLVGSAEENDRLREEIRELQQRVAALERLVGQFTNPQTSSSTSTGRFDPLRSAEAIDSWTRAGTRSWSSMTSRTCSTACDIFSIAPTRC